jgi:hypothetical protein
MKRGPGFSFGTMMVWAQRRHAQRLAELEAPAPADADAQGAHTLAAARMKVQKTKGTKRLLVFM